MAIQSLVIILTVLIALLVIGVPISYAIGISSLAAILQIVPMMYLFLQLHREPL